MSKVRAKCKGGLIYYLFGGWAHVDGYQGHAPEPVDKVQIDMAKVDRAVQAGKAFFRKRSGRKMRSKRR